MKNAGIDYGMGTTNIDGTTGIRYGVISQHTLGESWYECAEADYGKAQCPECGAEAEEYDDEKHGEYHVGEHQCADYACEACHEVFSSDRAYPEEALGYYYQDAEYIAADCLDSDVILTKSPYYTLAPFCSPCVPGAGNLDDAREGGVKTYCWGHDWFEDDCAPYPVYRVADDKRIVASREPVSCQLCNGTGRRTVRSVANARKQSIRTTVKQIASGEIANVQDYRDGSFRCWYCDGAGTRQETVYREQ